VITPIRFPAKIHRCGAFQIADHGQFLELIGDAGRLYLRSWADLAQMGKFAVRTAEAMQSAALPAGRPAEAEPTGVDTAGKGA